MKRATVAAVFLSAIWSGYLWSEPPHFDKVSEHCYYLQPAPGGENVAAIVTDEGVLIVDPPPEPDLSVTADALKRLTPKPVRWVVLTNPRSAFSAGARFFIEQGAVLLAAGQLRNLAASISGGSGELSPSPWLLFEREMRLFPSNLEIRIMAVQNRARTGADGVLYIPAEKVLVAGGLFEAARYPDIDTAAQGNAGEWIDGLKQVIDSIPVLKSAIPQTRTDPKEPEKTLEEGIAVVSLRGEVSNLQNMKDLLSAAQRLRTDILKTVKSGRSCENFLNSTRAGTYRVYGNFEAYAGQLCEEIQD